MENYLLDTNAYFAILRYMISNDKNKEDYEKVLNGNCNISKLTQIEIVSVIGKYARGSSGSPQVCGRIHVGEVAPCGKKFVEPRRRKWSSKKLHDWMKLEREISSGLNPKFNIKVLDIDEKVIKEAKKFIENALLHNFGSMDAMILGTAKANSTKEKEMIIVTADKGFKAGMGRINYPHISFGSID